MTRNNFPFKAKLIVFFSIFPIICFGELPEAKTSSEELHRKIQQAEDLFNASLFSDAIPIFQEILQTSNQQIDSLLSNKIRFRLAQAFFLIKDYPSAVHLLQNHPSGVNYQFLLGAAYRNNGEYDKAIAILQSYLDSNDGTFVQKEEALFELGLSFYLKGDLSTAFPIIEKVRKSSNERLQILSLFYLARIRIDQNLIDEALYFLNQTDALIKEDLLKFESTYLKGLAYYKNQDFERAVILLEQALPSNSKHGRWYEDTLYYLGLAYLQLFDHNPQPMTYFDRASKVFSKIEELHNDSLQVPRQFLDKGSIKEELIWLAMGEYYLKVGRKLKDEASLKKAESILSDSAKFTSQEVTDQALLLRAQTHLSYTERDRRLRQLTQPSMANSQLYPQAWYVRGLNDMEEGISLENLGLKEEAHRILERAAFAFEKAEELTREKKPEIQASAVLLQAQAYSFSKSSQAIKKSLKVLELLWENGEQLLKKLPDPLEAYLLMCSLSANLSEDYPPLISKLNEGITTFSKSSTKPEALYLLGTLLYKSKNYEKAEDTFNQIANDYPLIPLAADALFRSSQSAEKAQKSKAVIDSYKHQIIKEYPQSPIAPEAFFTLFSYQEYLQGDRQAIKHLSLFPSQYPNSPLVLNALFLMGLDNKRDRRSPEGKWIRKKNLTQAIDYFQQVESTFDSLSENQSIPKSEMKHYLLVRYRANLEKGLANFTMANESIGAKRLLYLEFAQEAFGQLLQQLSDGHEKYKLWMSDSESFWHLEEEGTYWLSQALIAAKQEEKAELLLSDMLKKYQLAKITRGYFLSKIWSALGNMEVLKKNHAKALECYLKAEDSSKGKLLPTDQRLENLIQQSHCLNELKQPEKAILVLSKAVNDDSVSSLRIKAMYLRALIYETQERYELARKQLEATAKKGGEWALKAKQKLEKEYGYH